MTDADLIPLVCALFFLACVMVDLVHRSVATLSDTNPFGDPRGADVSETRLGFAPYHYCVRDDGSVFAWRGQMTEREHAWFSGPEARELAAAWCRGRTP